MTDEHAIDIALLNQRLGQLEMAVKAQQATIDAQTIKVQELITAWQSATLLGKLLGVLGTLATIAGAIAAFIKGAK